MFDMSNMEDRDSIIRVVREVYVTVEKRQPAANGSAEV